MGNINREREMLCPDTGTSTMYFKITCNAGLLADFKDPIQNHLGVPALKAELHIAHVQSILLL